MFERFLRHLKLMNPSVPNELIILIMNRNFLIVIELVHFDLHVIIRT